MKTNTPTVWSYALPSTTDLDSDTVSVTVTIPSSASSFLTFASNELKIDNLQDELNTAIPLGSYNIDINLNDGVGGSTSYQITLEI